MNTIKQGDVVYAEGASALLGDVIAIDAEEQSAEVCWRKAYSTEAFDDLTVVPEARPSSPSSDTTGRAAIEARLDEVTALYAETVVPGVSDDSILETERDTLEWALSVLPAYDLVEAIRRVQNERNTAAQGHDLDDTSFVDELGIETYSEVKTLDRVLDILHLLALGQTPAQGEQKPYDPENDPDDTYGENRERFGPWDDSE